MKKHNIFYSALITLIVAGACKQDVVDLKEPVTPTPVAADKGTANFTKYVAMGTSYTAGFQAGALFTDGQNNSLPAILNKQFETVGAPSDFKQPTINSTFGYNIFVTPNPDADNHIFGRFLLQYNGATSPTPTPQLSDIGALPNPTYNQAFIFGNGTEKATLNNFGIPAIVLGQALITETGSWAGAGTDPRFSPFYGRLAYPGTGSTLVGDVAASAGTFFSFWMGMDDYMLYAAYGGDASKAPLTPTTGGLPYGFDGQYGAALGTLMTANPTWKGVVANLPDIFTMPHFTSVPWNAIALTADDQATVIDPTNAAYATYNGGLDQIFGLGAISASERDARKIKFAVGANGIVIEDQSLTDLTAYGLPSIRQATSSDIFPLAAGGVIGKESTPGDPTTTWGVAQALTDQYVIVPVERDSINGARTAYNSIIFATVANPAFADRLALADVATDMATLVSNSAGVYNNVTITPNIDPPTGIYSEDGLHPNSRGYAFISLTFIKAINAKFGSTIPLTDLSQYKATALPIP